METTVSGEHDIPRLFLLLPQSKKKFLSKIRSADVFNTSWRLWFLDPITLTPAMSGPEGKGYKVLFERRWFSESRRNLLVKLAKTSVHCALNYFGVDRLFEFLGDALDIHRAYSRQIRGDLIDGHNFFLEGKKYRIMKKLLSEIDPEYQHTGLEKKISQGHCWWILEKDRARFELEGLSCLHEKVQKLIRDKIPKDFDEQGYITA